MEPGRKDKTLTPIVTVGRAEPADRAEKGKATGGPGWALPFTLAVGLGLLVLLVALPGGLGEKLAFLNSGVCPQRPAHSYFFQGRQMPLEARMVGIFAGFGLTLFGLWLVGRGRALQWPRRSIGLGLAGLVGLMAFDGFNSTFWDLGWPTLYTPQNWLRLLTGVASGVGIAGLVLPAVNLVIWRRGYLITTFKSGLEIGLALLAGLLYALGVLAGWDWLYWPLSVLAVIGVIVMLLCFNLMIAAIVLRRENQAANLVEFLALATPVFLVSLAEMMLFAAFRVALAGNSPTFF